jgi:hypothetical protein
LGGALALDAAWLFAAFLVILVLLAAGIAARRFLLERGGGTVECGLRRPGRSGWRLGVASYQREELYWFRVFGISMRPVETFPRRDLTVVARRQPTQAETATLGPGMVVIECRLGGQATVELALTEAALTGLLAWLEASPPGSHLDVAL